MAVTRKRRNGIVHKKPKETIPNVAVVYCGDSKWPDGHLVCFVGNDKAECIRKAMEAARGWTSRTGKTYRILVGKLTEKAIVPTDYRLEKIGG